MTEFHKKGRKV